MRATTLSDTSASVSRSVMKLIPARRLSWTSCPSTQTPDIRWTYSAIFADRWRTGHGCSAVVSRARAGRSLTRPQPASSRGPREAARRGANLDWAHDQACAARRPPRLLRRGGPRRHRRREGPGALRAAGLRAQGDRAQQARRRDARGPRCGVRRRDRRGAGGRAGGLLRARGLAGRAPGGGGTRPADHRRDLPVGDQGPQGGRPVRRRGPGHPADRSHRPRGGRGHGG